MEIKEITSNLLKEKYFYVKHPCGLNIYLYPKKNYKSYYAILGVNYGSIDIKFKVQDKNVEVPAGIAHYLEHKLFEGKNENAFELYAKTGASANAYTSFDKTAYLFSCSDNFNESLGILLDFVQSPYFTQENTDKEREIIAQEIKMYEDSPEWKVFFNLLCAMYKTHPIKYDIAGTVDSISKITPNYLYECYKAFYNLENMSLCISGDIEINSVLELIDKHISYSSKVTTQRIIPEEPIGIDKSFIKQSLDVKTPLFQFGFKGKCGVKEINEKDFACINMILKAITSKGSLMYNKLMDMELINTDSFSCEYMEVPGASAVIFSGESKNPEKVSEIIKNEVFEICKRGIDSETFNWARKSTYAEYVSGLNSVRTISNDLLDFSFSGREYFSYIDCMPKITLEELNLRLKTHFDIENTSLSVVNPVGN